ncbi:MAG: hypothetical protein WA949_21095 [Phormidesmis sp.]
MDRIQKQASALWELLFDEETAETYQSALNLTGKILTDLAQLIWLIVCSVFVFAAWFSDAAVKAGNRIRAWVDQQTGETPTAAETKSLSEKGEELLGNSRVAIVQLLNKARGELGLEAEPLPTPASEKAAISSASESSAPKASPAVTSPTVPQTTASVEVAAPKTTALETTTPKTTMVSAGSTEDVANDRVEDTGLDEDTQDESWPPQTDDD